MIFGYVIIGLIAGIIIGVGAMYIGNSKLHQKKFLQYKQNNDMSKIEEYREELSNYFAYSAKLLDNIATDYQQLYQYMAKSSNNLLPEITAESNPFHNRLIESEANNDQIPVQMPRDYSGNASGLLRGIKKCN